MLRPSGFTLIETVIYTTLIGIVLGSFMSFSLLIMANKSKNTVMQEVNNNNRVVHEFIMSELRWAQAIISPALGVASSSVKYRDQSGEIKTITRQNNTLLFLSEAGQVTLTSPRVQVTSTQFTHLGVNSILFNWDISSLASSSQEFDYQVTHQSAATLLPF